MAQALYRIFLQLRRLFMINDWNVQIPAYGLAYVHQVFSSCGRVYEAMGTRDYQITCTQMSDTCSLAVA